MDTKTAARLGALAFVVVAVAATAIQFHHGEQPLPLAGEAPAMDAAPLRDELIRCQSLGAAGAQDNECLRIWAENRRRFLAQSPSPTAPPPVSPSAPQSSAPNLRPGAN